MFLLGPLYARNIWKRCFHSKTHQISMFSVHTTTDLEQFEKATITPAVVNWGLFSRSFPVHIKTHLKPPVRRAFRKVSFLWRIGVEGRPKCKNKSCVFRFLRPSEDAGLKSVTFNMKCKDAFPAGIIRELLSKLIQAASFFYFGIIGTFFRADEKLTYLSSWT